MEAGSLIRFNVTVPLDHQELFENVAHCLARRLPEVCHGPPQGHVRIIANGPSALRAPLEGGVTVALNGAIRLFTEKGLAPDYWMACDPQEILVSFLDDTPLSTHYLLASKIHPRVFDHLIKRGCRVSVWHVDEDATRPLVEGRDPVPCASTITLTCFKVLERMGFRSFETWGWDGCYDMEGRHHANSFGGERGTIQLAVGGRNFVTTTSHALEAQEASAVLGDWPWPLGIQGGGMIAEVLALQWAQSIRSVIARHAALALERAG